MKMFRYIFITLTGIMLLAACEKFLDRTPAAAVTDAQIFGTYADFQGFLDPNYFEIRNYIGHYQSTTLDAGGETLNNFISWSPAYTVWSGEYVHYFAGADAGGFTDGTSLFSSKGYGYGINASAGNGIWTGGWRGIRVCNIALQNYNLLSQATPEEKNLILIAEQQMKSGPEANHEIMKRYIDLMIKADSYDLLPSENSEMVFYPSVFQNVWNEASQLRKSGKLIRYADDISCPVVALHGDYDPHPAEGVKVPLSNAMKNFRFIIKKSMN